MRPIIVIFSLASPLLGGNSPTKAQEIVDLRIEGPGRVPENSYVDYRAFALFDNGQEYDVTLFAILTVSPGTNASINPFGNFHAFETGDENKIETVHASFDFGGISLDADFSVVIEYSVQTAGSALDFDGSDDIVYIPPSDSLRYPGAGGWTIEAWIQPRNTHPALISPILGQLSLGLPGHDPYLLEIGDGQVHFRIENNFGTIQRVSAPIDAQWNHVAGVYDPLEGVVLLYINGREAAWEPISTLMESNAAYPVIIGGQGDGPRQFEGRIDDIRIWRTARAHCEIGGYFNRRISGSEPDLVGNWRFDAREGQDVLDSSPYGNSGWLGLIGGVDGQDPIDVSSGADLSQPPYPPIDWSSPEFLPQLSSGADYEASISYDGLELYIASERDGFAETDIYRSTRISFAQPFSAPVRVTEVSIPGYEQHDGAPSLSANKLRLYFARQNGHGPGDLWLAMRSNSNSAWNTPVPISSLNTNGREGKICVSADELHAAFTSDRSGSMRFWTASRSSVEQTWTNLELIDALTEFDPRSCSLTPDGLTIYFTATGPTGLGSHDVWMARRSSVSEPFGNPVHLPTLSTPYPDLGISISADGREIYLVPENSFHGNIYISRFEIGGGPLDFELDCDGDVDIDDFYEFSPCLAGPDAVPSIGCAAADLETDGHIDLADFARLQNSFTL